MDLVLQGDYARSLVAAPDEGLEARELMESLQKAFGGWWHRREGQWVLALWEGNVPRVAMPRTERDRERVANIRALALSLSAEQWTALGRGKWLPWQELPREQQAIALTQVRLDYYDPERARDAAPAERAANRETISLRVTGKGRKARFGIGCLRADGKDYFPSTPFYQPDGRLTWGILPPN